MIFISADSRRSGVFFGSLVTTTVGEPMNKSGTLIASALLSIGIAAAAMAADMPKAAAPMAADTPAAGSTDAGTAKPAGKKHKGGKSGKSSGKSNKKPTGSNPPATSK
ncbi:MAG TPA: hypothetical protein VK437_00655 [Steroidobacteraceae bacterium]|nr:hypothetical protein [Steroidobacteraceae bacterium]